MLALLVLSFQCARTRGGGGDDCNWWYLSVMALNITESMLPHSSHLRPRPRPPHFKSLLSCSLTEWVMAMMPYWFSVSARCRKIRNKAASLYSSAAERSTPNSRLALKNFTENLKHGILFAHHWIMNCHNLVYLFMNIRYFPSIYSCIKCWGTTLNEQQPACYQETLLPWGLSLTSLASN